MDNAEKKKTAVPLAIGNWIENTINLMFSKNIY